ncbi:MAG: winged helix-turn-helix transcriptional regulator [Lachnospiraceae bacterium]|nr:winged helix-turn-helix transcriptional regulator [Lachnospiraceae bacterium]
MSFEGDFQTIYTKFKLHFYGEIFGNWTAREAALTTVETFCMEVIYAMRRPTINEFANFIKISQPNAAYKVNNLTRKGFLRKIRSQKDKREYFLEVTDKYLEYLDIENSYMHKVLERLESRFTKTQLEELDNMLKIISSELMPEIPDFQNRKREA